MTGQAEPESNPTQPAAESGSEDGYSNDEGWEADDNGVLSIRDFIAGDQTKAPNSPRTLQVCAEQGLEIDDLVLLPYEEITAASDQERKLRFEAREKRRHAYIKEVNRGYRHKLQAKRPRSLPNLDSVRSQVASNRKERVNSLLSREQKALARHERVLQDSLHRSVSEHIRADELEKKYIHKLADIEGQQRRQYRDRQEASVNRSVWRGSKLDKAREIAALELERHANKMLDKEHVRLRALQNKEQQQVAQQERRRQQAQQKAAVVAHKLTNQEALKSEAEDHRQEVDALREKAYQDSMSRHRIEAELRGKQKNIVIDYKREKVRSIEREVVEHHRQAVMAKEAAFERRIAMDDQKKQRIAEKRHQWEKRCGERLRQVQQREEAKTASMEKQLEHAEHVSERALSKRNRQLQSKAMKLQIRNDELEVASRKLARMEAYKQNELLAKMDLEAERDHVLQQERQKESELLRALKRDTALMQKQIKDKAIKQYRKMRLTESISMNSPSPSTRAASVEPSHSQINE